MSTGTGHGYGVAAGAAGRVAADAAGGVAAGTRPLVAVGPGRPVTAIAGVTTDGSVAALSSVITPGGVGYVSPLRSGTTGTGPDASLPRIEPSEPITTYFESPSAETETHEDDEPAVPDEARARIIADASASTPLDGGR